MHSACNDEGSSTEYDALVSLPHVCFDIVSFSDREGLP